MTDRPSNPGSDEVRQSLAMSLAAISICESLIVALKERKLLDADEIDEAIRSGIESHMRAEPSVVSAETHADAAQLMERILTGANAIRAAAHL